MKQKSCITSFAGLSAECVLSCSDRRITPIWPRALHHLISDRMATLCLRADMAFTQIGRSVEGTSVMLQSTSKPTFFLSLASSPPSLSLVLFQRNRFQLEWA